MYINERKKIHNDMFFINYFVIKTILLIKQLNNLFCSILQMEYF